MFQDTLHTGGLVFLRLFHAVKSLGGLVSSLPFQKELHGVGGFLQLAVNPPHLASQQL